MAARQSQQGTPRDTAELEAAFSAFAQNYERQSGGITRKVAEKALQMLSPITFSSVVHDNGCGPGIVTTTILRDAAAKGTTPPKIEATDVAKGMIELLQSEILKNGWNTVNAQIRDSSDLGCFEDGTFTHSITNFAIFTLPDPAKGAREIRRTLKDGGVALVTVWSSMDNLAIIHGAQKAIRPDLPVFNPASPDWFHDWKVRSVMEEAGFSKVEVKEVKNYWEIESEQRFSELFDDPFWNIVKKDWTDEDKAKWHQECLNQFTDEQRGDKRLRANAWVCIATK